jgi:hypothetical protein
MAHAARVGPMLTCVTCGSRFDAHARSAAGLADAGCPLCGDALAELGGRQANASEPVHADVASILREHLLGVGA